MGGGNLITSWSLRRASSLKMNEGSDWYSYHTSGSGRAHTYSEMLICTIAEIYYICHAMCGEFAGFVLYCT